MCAPLFQDLLLHDTYIFATPVLQLLTLSIPMCFFISTTKCNWGISHDQKGMEEWKLLLQSHSWCASCVYEVVVFIFPLNRNYRISLIDKIVCLAEI